MKRVDGYQCDNCKEIHSTAQLATDCESAHKARMEGAKITHMSFDSKEGVYGIDRGYVERVPKSISVRFSEHYGDFGIFVLKQYGPRGL